MKTGVFLPIGNNGWIVSKNSPQYLPSFALSTQICRLAESAGMDFALSMVKWRGWHGATEYWDHTQESLTSMAALAAVTDKLDLYASVACPTLHPAVVARMAATIDDVSEGRFGVNLVAGWNKHEYTQMGLWPGDEFYGERYDYSTEFAQVMKELWSAGRGNFAGKYFTLDDCAMSPKPSRDIPIICAGMSPRGLRFAAEVGTIDFMHGTPEQLVQLRKMLDEACAVTGRSVDAYALFGIVAAETDEEAVAMATHYLDGADEEALRQQAVYAANDSAGSVSDSIFAKALKRPTITLPEDGTAALVHGLCFQTMNLVGSYERVARSLDAVEAAGMAGVVMSFPDFVVGVQEYGARIVPLRASGS